MKRIGKIGRWKSRQGVKIKRMFLDNDINTCEIGSSPETKFLHTNFKKCTGQMYPTPAHRHKQIWYNTKDHALYSAYTQVVWACSNCHSIIEEDRELTEKVFMILRGDE